MKNFTEIMSKLWSNEISQEQLNSTYKNDFIETDIIEGLQKAFEIEDSEESEAIFHIAFTFNLFTNNSTEILGKLISQVWHKQHEDIARIFQELKDPNSITSLMEAVHIKCDYWIDNGDAFIRKCMYALSHINTKESKLKLTILSNDSNEIVKKYAQQHLNK